MGEVYRARMRTAAGVEKLVALKAVRPDLASSPDAMRLFLGEAKVALTLAHANIVHALDVEQHDDALYIAMEHIDGVDLAALIEARGRLPIAAALTIAIEVLKGLDYAHRVSDEHGRHLGIVHRDVSPSNVLLSTEGEVKLTDFGVAKSSLRDGTITTGGVRGKVAYMAPEQLRGGAIDARADLYALGVVLYEMLAGRRPIAGDDGLALVPLVLEGRVDPLTAVAPEVPSDLAALVMRAIATEPSGRFSSAAAMRTALERWAVDHGVLLSTSDLADDVRHARETKRPGGDAQQESDEVAVPPTRVHAVAPAKEAKFELRLDSGERGTQRVEVAPAVERDEERPRPRWPWVILAFAIVGGAIGGWVVMETGKAEPVAVAPRPPTPPPAADPPERVRAPDPEPPPIPATIETPPERVEAPATRTKRSPRIPPASHDSPGLGATLTIGSNPWAYVEIDGQRIGRTAIRNHALPPGRHHVVLHNPEANLRREIDVTLDPGEAERLTVDLARP